MEAFQLLSRGGACFDKQRFKSDVQLFTKADSKSAKEKTGPVTQDSELPAELDFFKYAQGAAGKRKAANAGTTSSSAPQPSDVRRKRRKVDNESDHSDDDEDTEAADDTPRPKHRVTSKGSDVPLPVDAFDIKPHFSNPVEEPEDSR
ncbi:hypothetical protein PAXINDRAFT_95026 [Paxillus involutus ATCC 200175]|nr:hypothetical protein PAXINDRAFT_95026 [Paxillus involutus ATCC 200175]